MIADENFYDMFYIFYPMASAMAKGQRPKFVRAKHSATVESENCAYGPTLVFDFLVILSCMYTKVSENILMYMYHTMHFYSLTKK